MNVSRTIDNEVGPKLHSRPNIQDNSNFFHSILGDTKIFCLQEETNKKFRFLYAIQKNSNNNGLFEKFVFIKLDERFIGIKRVCL